MTEKIRILVVEDEGLVAEDLKDMLLGFGYEVPGIAKTGEKAIALVDEYHPDLVLMDINLASEMDGITAGGEIRSRWGIPIIYVTAFATQAIIDRAKKTAPSGYILKPFNERQIQTAIEIGLYNSALEQHVKEHDATISTLINATSNLIILIDTKGIIRGLNDAMAKKAEKTVDQLTGSSVYDLVSSGILSPKMVGWNRTQIQRHSIQFEEEFKGNWFDIGVHPICNPLGNVVKYAIYIHDITSSKKIEAQLLQNEEFFRTLLEDTADIIVIMNKDGTFRHESPSLNRVVGYTQGQLAGKNLFSLVQKDNADNARQIFNLILQNPYMVKSFRIVLKNKMGKPVAIKGIISNLSDNPVIEGIVLCGWIVTNEHRNRNDRGG
jgi:PAS domain S-box-containing protein